MAMPLWLVGLDVLVKDEDLPYTLLVLYKGERLPSLN